MICRYRLVVFRFVNKACCFSSPNPLFKSLELFIKPLREGIGQNYIASVIVSNWSEFHLQ